MRQRKWPKNGQHGHQKHDGIEYLGQATTGGCLGQTKQHGPLAVASSTKALPSSGSGMKTPFEDVVLTNKLGQSKRVNEYTREQWTSDYLDGSLCPGPDLQWLLLRKV
jgi:hypothetical protein